MQRGRIPEAAAAGKRQRRTRRDRARLCLSKETRLRIFSRAARDTCEAPECQVRKKQRITEIYRAAVLLLLLSAFPALAGCARGGLFRADDYYLVNGSEASGTGKKEPEQEAISESARKELATPQKAADRNSAEEDDGSGELEGWRDILQTVWIAYWDDHIDEALDQYGEMIGNICMFSACYDTEGRVFFPPDMVALMEKIRAKDPDHRWKYYLSVTNDVLADDWSSAKDADLLHNLLDRPEDARRHAQMLADLAEGTGYDGLEIDYECLYSDMDLWKSFLVFEDALIEETGKRNLDLRIVLEPATPKEGLTFPEGPEYVMMCYDLHGFGTDPGAKADRDFLTGLVNDFSFVPGLEFALANGGFDWNLDTGYVTTMSEQNIQDLLSRYEFDKQRGDTSGALYGIYEADDGQKHTVWYADQDTLRLWYRYLCEAAGRQIRCSLWKL